MPFWPDGSWVGRTYMNSAFDCRDGVRSSRCRCCEDVETAFEVVGDGGEPDVHAGVGKAAPSHPAQAVAALPGAEDLLDATTNPMDRLISGLEPGQRFGFVVSPYASGDDTRHASPGPRCIAETATATGAVGNGLAGIVGQCLVVRPAVIEVDWAIATSPTGPCRRRCPHAP